MTDFYESVLRSRNQKEPHHFAGAGTPNPLMFYFFVNFALFMSKERSQRRSRIIFQLGGRSASTVNNVAPSTMMLKAEKVNQKQHGIKQFCEFRLTD
jgi:hypothetical protein